MARAVSASVMTRAAAPSETREQSVRFKGGATKGFFSLSRRQNSKPRSFRICAQGLSTPFLWFLAAMAASASDWSPWRWK
jgi:hypothetical protein